MSTQKWACRRPPGTACGSPPGFGVLAPHDPNSDPPAGRVVHARRRRRRVGTGAISSLAHGFHHGGAGFGRAVHVEAVVPSRTGNDFVTVTYDRGKVTGVSGDQLTIREGTADATYDTKTFTVPDGAVAKWGSDSHSLSALSVGDRVVVVRTPSKTRVLAGPDRTEGVRRHR